MAISSDNTISIKASVTDSESTFLKAYQNSDAVNTPWHSIGLFASELYRIKLVGLSDNDKEIFKKEYDSDSFGNFDLRLKAYIGEQKITKLQLYEISQKPGLELLLGSFIPTQIVNPKKIIISDFDKTLCDTKFSTTKEIVKSLSSPLSTFPTIEKSVQMLKDHLAKGFQPFILSASPHFYEKVVRDWLYNHQIYQGSVFLKDYRNIFSFTDGILTPKDLKKQGYYKLTQLVNILSMTGVPEELVLMGDGFESDTFIYLTLASIIINKADPWNIWNQIKRESPFSFTTKQNFQFLSKFYQLGEMAKANNTSSVKIYIRCTDENIDILREQNFKFKFLQDQKALVDYYVA